MANLDKSVIYFNGMEDRLQEEIVDTIGMPIGELPFRYIGVPLPHKKLTISRCMPPIEHWSWNFLCLMLLEWYSLKVY